MANNPNMRLMSTVTVFVLPGILYQCLDQIDASVMEMVPPMPARRTFLSL